MTKYKYIKYGDQNWWFIDNWFFLYYESIFSLHAMRAKGTREYPLASPEDIHKLIRIIWTAETTKVDS